MDDDKKLFINKKENTMKTIIYLLQIKLGSFISNV